MGNGREINKDELRELRNMVNYELLKPIHKAVAKLLATGNTQTAVAKELGIRPETVSNYFNVPGFTDYVNELADIHALSAVKIQAEARHAFNGLVAEATETLAQLMRSSSSDTVRHNSCVKILDYAGLKPTDKHEIEEKYTEQLVMTDPALQGAVDNSGYDEDDCEDESEIVRNAMLEIGVNPDTYSVKRQKEE